MSGAPLNLGSTTTQVASASRWAPGRAEGPDRALAAGPLDNPVPRSERWGSGRQDAASCGQGQNTGAGAKPIDSLPLPGR